MWHFAVLVGCAVVIYRGSEYFVNAVEWLGVRLRLGPIAIGTVLAGVGTALPESVVTVVAVFFGDDETGPEIAVGAAMGGPLVVGTIAYGAVGMMLLDRRRRGFVADWSAVDSTRLLKDQRWFMVIFAAKAALGLVVFAWKPWCGLAFLLVYAMYLRRELRPSGGQDSGEDLEPLAMQPRRVLPATWAVVVQSLLSLGLVFLTCQIFVAQLEWAGPILGLSPAVVALLLSPIATELPEVLNAIIWTRRGKTQLAISNICGSMMIQATVPSAVGLWMTPWNFGPAVVSAAGATLLTVGIVHVLLLRSQLTARRLACAAGGYLLFAMALVLSS